VEAPSEKKNVDPFNPAAAISLASAFCRCAFNPTAPPPPAVAAAPYKSRRAKLRRPRRYAYAALREPNSESL